MEKRNKRKFSIFEVIRKHNLRKAYTVKSIWSLCPVLGFRKWYFGFVCLFVFITIFKEHKERESSYIQREKNIAGQLI